MPVYLVPQVRVRQLRQLKQGMVRRHRAEREVPLRRDLRAESCQGAGHSRRLHGGFAVQRGWCAPWCNSLSGDF